ncbi:MAG: hypothetical protein AVO34_14155 [Firmicutes bacterium ML8_F2]|jgi:hypothetical protein|nr:MAG: hypothetical protein AVO34_14155 [Firmicutes bacterium ML8_F2]
MREAQNFRFYMNRKSNPELYDYLCSLQSGTRSSYIRSLIFLGYEKESLLAYITELIDEKLSSQSKESSLDHKLSLILRLLEDLESNLSRIQTGSVEENFPQDNIQHEQKGVEGAYLSNLSEKEVKQLRESVNIVKGKLKRS